MVNVKIFTRYDKIIVYYVSRMTFIKSTNALDINTFSELQINQFQKASDVANTGFLQLLTQTLPIECVHPLSQQHPKSEQASSFAPWQVIASVSWQ